MTTEKLRQAREDLDYYLENSGTLAHNKTWKEKFENIRHCLYSQITSELVESMMLDSYKVRSDYDAGYNAACEDIAKRMEGKP